MPSIEEIPARAGRALRVGRGEALQIINTFGTQVVDFWAFDVRDPLVHLSMEHSRATLSRLTPRVGDILVDNRREPMLGFESDTSPGVHDTVIAACDPARYAKLGSHPIMPAAPATCIRPSDRWESGRRPVPRLSICG